MVSDMSVHKGAPNVTITHDSLEAASVQGAARW